MESDEVDACDLMDTVVSPTSIVDIWSVIMVFETDHGARAETYSGGMRLLTQDLRLLYIFGQVPCEFCIFGLVLTSVEYVNYPNQIPGR